MIRRCSLKFPKVLFCFFVFFFLLLQSPWVSESVSVAMFTVWLDKNLTKALPEKYLCQLTRQKAYAELHNYSYFIFTEPDKGWFEEKSDFELTIPWFKLYTFRRLLASDTHYDWIVYIDTDAIPKDPKLPFEVLFRENPRASLLLRDDKGWNTHAIFLKKNSGFSHWLLDYTWSLRKKFNNCVKEQCALNLALFEAIKREELRKDMAQRYSLKPSSSLCCNPAITLPKNHQNAQGCTWTLQEATKVREKNKHPHIHWIQGDNRKLNILHPLKTMECDDVANLSPSSLPLVPPIRQNWTYPYPLETGNWTQKVSCKQEQIAGSSKLRGFPHSHFTPNKSKPNISKPNEE